MSKSMNETKIAELAAIILGETVRRSDTPEGVTKADQTLASSSWLEYFYSRRLDGLDNRMVKWTAAAAIAGSSAATLSFITLIIILLGLRYAT